MIKLKLEHDQHQWNQNQRVIISGKDVKAEDWRIHFIAPDESEARVLIPTLSADGTISAMIPNDYFQTAQTLICYAYSVADDQAYTETGIEIVIRPRPKPEDYVYTETEVWNYSTVYELANSALQRADYAVETAAPVPDYLIAEAERVASAVSSERSAHTLVFVVAGDFHLRSENPEYSNRIDSAKAVGIGIRELSKLIPLDFTALLGDYTGMTGAYTVEQVKNDLTTARKTLDISGISLWCVGERELNFGSLRDRMMSLDEIYAYVGAASDGVKPYESLDRGYFYRDFDAQKIRVIGLNTADAYDWDVSDGVKARSEWISPTQMHWMVDCALDFSGKNASEWGIVIISHHPLHYAYGCFSQFMKLLEAYRDRLSGSISCTVKTIIDEQGSTIYQQQPVKYDFSLGEAAEILCNIHGHNHNCDASRISSSSGQNLMSVTPWLWRICIPNCCVGLENYYAGNSNAVMSELHAEYDDDGNPVYWTKQSDSAKSTSFAVVSVDRDKREIRTNIFGAGRDRVLSLDADYRSTAFSGTFTDYPDTTEIGADTVFYGGEEQGE